MNRSRVVLALAFMAILAAVLSAGGVEAALPAQYLSMQLYGRSFQGQGWDLYANQTLEVVLADASGAVQGECRRRVTGSGIWSCGMDNGALVRPGYTLHATVGGVDLGTATVPKLAIRRISPARDTVGGRVAPAGLPGAAELVLRDLNFTPGGQQSLTSVLAVAPDATGRFQVSAAGQHDILQMTGVELLYIQGPMVISAYSQAPGFNVEIGDNYVSLGLLPNGTYTASLLGRTGNLKGVQRFEVGPGRRETEISFFNRRGPVTIRPRDRFVVTGPTSMSLRIPRMDVTYDSAADTVSFRTLADTTGEADVGIVGPTGSVVWHSFFPTTDAEGRCTFSTAPFDLKNYDLFELWFRNARGSYFKARFQVIQ